MIKARFELAKSEHRACFVAFVTAGYPTIDLTVDILLGLQDSGVDIVELGVPFSDPLADGPIIQMATHAALRNGVTMQVCFDIVTEARRRGLKIPVIAMGYLNPFLSFGFEKWAKSARQVGISGVILVDLPPEEARSISATLVTNGISLIPFVSPTSPDSRIELAMQLCKDGFVYVISSMGVTGNRHSLNPDLPALLQKIRSFSTQPLAVGFGIATPEQFLQVAAIADGVVIGSKLIQTIQNAFDKQEPVVDAVKAYVLSISSVNKSIDVEISRNSSACTNSFAVPESTTANPFGEFGGQYAPETLINALNQLEKAFESCKKDPQFWKELEYFQKTFVGRPSPLQLAKNLSDHCGGARIWLKREDLNHTGSHKINNALGQILMARRLGKKRIIAETGAGQHGVATATVCAQFGMECVVYMGKTDTIRQSLNVFRMRLLGATVVPVVCADGSGDGRLKDAINEAMRDWVTNVETTHYLVGSAIGPHPFPTIVREFQSVIGAEVKKVFAELNDGRLPDALVACVGGGSNAIGLFAPFKSDKNVRFIGVEAGGEGISSEKHSAPLSAGTPGVLHGCKTYLMQDSNGQIIETHSISAGLDYPGVGPEHSFMKDSGRAEYVSATDKEAIEGLLALSQHEGIIPALETSHAVFYAMKLAKTLKATQDIVIGISGRGDKDVEQVQKLLPNYDLSVEKSVNF